MIEPIIIPLFQIDDNPFQSRRDYGNLGELAADIEARGLLQVPRGRLMRADGSPVGEDDLATALADVERAGFPDDLRVQLVFGHRRLRAFRRLSIDPTHDGHAKALVGAMPVYVGALTDDEMIDGLWSENARRADTNPIEQAELMAAKLRRIRAAGGTTETLAAEWGLARPTVANRLRLLALPGDAKEAVRRGEMSERQALALLSVLAKQAASGEEIVAMRQMSSDALRAVARVIPSPEQNPLPPVSIDPEPPAGEATAVATVAPSNTPRTRGPAAGLLPNDAPVPMLYHGGLMDAAGVVEWERLRTAARRACRKCIGLMGPPRDVTCRECPGVHLVMALRSL